MCLTAHPYASGHHSAIANVLLCMSDWQTILKIVKGDPGVQTHFDGICCRQPVPRQPVPRQTVPSAQRLCRSVCEMTSPSSDIEHCNRH